MYPFVAQRYMHDVSGEKLEENVPLDDFLYFWSIFNSNLTFSFVQQDLNLVSLGRNHLLNS